MYDGQTFRHEGHDFRVHIERNDCMGPPWEEHDGHGVVSEWTHRSKRPSERELCSDRGSRRFYDIKASITIATKDRWGLGDEELAKLEAKLGRAATKREITAQAVELDFDRLRGWCNGEWGWLSVGVERLDGDGGETEWLGGIDGDGPYIEEVAHELAEQVLYPAREAWRSALAAAREARDMRRLCSVLAAPLMGLPA